MNDYNFGNFVCVLREKKELTQADVASLLGITLAAVSKWENGASKLRVEVLFELAKILGGVPRSSWQAVIFPRKCLIPRR